MAEERVPLYIDNKRIVNGKVEYLVRWENSSAKEKTWEKASDLSCPHLIKNIEQEVSFKHRVMNFKDYGRPLRVHLAIKENDVLFFALKILGRAEVVKATYEEAVTVCPDLVIKYFENKVQHGYREDYTNPAAKQLFPTQYVEDVYEGIRRVVKSEFNQMDKENKNE